MLNWGKSTDTKKKGTDINQWFDTEDSFSYWHLWIYIFWYGKDSTFEEEWRRVLDLFPALHY